MKWEVSNIEVPIALGQEPQFTENGCEYFPFWCKMGTLFAGFLKKELNRKNIVIVTEMNGEEGMSPLPNCDNYPRVKRICSHTMDDNLDMLRRLGW